MNVIHSVSAKEYKYEPSRPDMPTHYEFEFVNNSNKYDEPPECTLIALAPNNTLERRAIATIVHQIQKHRSIPYVAEYYADLFTDNTGKLNYQLPDHLLMSRSFELQKNNLYSVKFTEEESLHVKGMINAYSIFIDQEEDRCMQRRSKYIQRNVDLSNLALLTKLMNQYRSPRFKK